MRVEDRIEKYSLAKLDYKNKTKAVLRYKVKWGATIMKTISKKEGYTSNKLTNDIRLRKFWQLTR